MAQCARLVEKSTQETRPARYAPVRLLADIAGWSGLAQSEPGRDTLSDPPQTSMPAAPAKEPRTPTPRAAVGMPAGITLDKLERIRKVMAAGDSRHDWGDIYDQLLAAEHARAITPLNDRYLLERIRPLLQRLQDFLQGRAIKRPEVRSYLRLGYFICYTLEMFREGAALWRCVNKDEVNAWQYERTAKFSGLSDKSRLKAPVRSPRMDTS